MATHTRPRSQVTPRTVWTVALNVLALVALLWLFAKAWTVLTWVMVALFLALAANPLVRWLEARGLRRGLGVLAVSLLGLGLLGALLMTLVPMLIEQGRGLVRAAPDYIERLQHHPWVQKLDERYDLIDRVSAELRNRISMAPGPVLGVVTNILRELAAGMTIAVLTVFFLLFGADLFDKALQWVEPSRREHWRNLGHEMHRTVGGYVAGAFLISFIGGGVTAVSMLLLGVPYFLPLGLAMAVLGLIPFVGSLLGAILVSVTTLASVGTKEGLIALGVFLVYQQVEGNLLQPLIQRRTLKMNPLLIALVMLVGTSLTGLIGALLALPIAGAVQVLLQDRLVQLREQWRNGEGGERRVILAPEDTRPREGPPAEPPVIQH
ncbi:AI-2E family transporter [Archangium minus]|uniref:AI-2E family transporter n=1 Tax=Archangium minus TaxID=83450 RepID=A0ABY9X751_9BACT|nr:AI-2E family transporter [Archangium violaceum]WNG51223.1 AI-2E family transporter [Archangium minus]